MALKKSELYSSLWSGCDELRGGPLAHASKRGGGRELLTGRIRLV